MYVHKKHDDYHEYFTHNNRACKCPYKTILLHLSYSGLYKITTESIKLILDFEQFGASSDLIVLTPNVQKVSYFFFFLHILVKTFHGFHRNAIEYFSA